MAQSLKNIETRTDLAKAIEELVFHAGAEAAGVCDPDRTEREKDRLRSRLRRHLDHVGGFVREGRYSVEDLLTQLDKPLHDMVGAHKQGTPIYELADRIHGDLHELLQLLCEAQ